MNIEELKKLICKIVLQLNDEDYLRRLLISVMMAEDKQKESD